MSKFSLTLLLFCLAGCIGVGAGAAQSIEKSVISTPSCVSEELIIDGSLVSYCGRMTHQLVSSLRTHLEANPVEHFVIRSRGGNAVSSVRLADLLDENEISVEVHTECVSACMTLVFLTDDVTVREATTLGVHHTGASLLPLFVKWVRTEEGNEVSVDQILGVRGVIFEIGAYKRHGVAYWPLSHAMKFLEPNCISEVNWSKDGKLSSVRFNRNYDYWLMSRSLLDDARGSKIKGWWPKSRAELKHPNHRGSSRLKFIDVLDHDFSKLEKIEYCSYYR